MDARETFECLLGWTCILGSLKLGWFLFSPRSTPRNATGLPGAFPDSTSPRDCRARYLESRWIPFVVPFAITVVVPAIVLLCLQIPGGRRYNPAHVPWYVAGFGILCLISLGGALRAGIYQIRSGQRKKGTVTLVLFALFLLALCVSAFYMSFGLTFE